MKPSTVFLFGAGGLAGFLAWKHVKKTAVANTNTDTSTVPGVTGAGDVDDIRDSAMKIRVAQLLLNGTDSDELRAVAMQLTRGGYPIAAGRLEAKAAQIDLSKATPAPIPPIDPNVSPPDVVPVSGNPAFVRQGSTEYGYGQLMSDGSFLKAKPPAGFTPPAGWAVAPDGYLLHYNPDTGEFG